jgi:hypothetical protein
LVATVILKRHKQLEFGPLVFLLEKLSLIKKRGGEQLFNVILSQKIQLPAPFSMGCRTSAVHVRQAEAC